MCYCFAFIVTFLAVFLNCGHVLITCRRLVLGLALRRVHGDTAGVGFLGVVLGRNG